MLLSCDVTIYIVLFIQDWTSPSSLPWNSSIIVLVIASSKSVYTSFSLEISALGVSS